MILLDFVTNVYLMAFYLVLSKPGFKQNCTVQKVNPHALLIHLQRESLALTFSHPWAKFQIFATCLNAILSLQNIQTVKYNFISKTNISVQKFNECLIETHHSMLF